MSFTATSNYPVDVVKCSPNLLNKEIFSRYSSLSQFNMYNNESELSSTCDCTSNYIKKLNVGLRMSGNSRLYSSVCFPSTARESLLERISCRGKDDQTKTGKKKPIIRFREGKFKSLKIVKPISASMIKADSQMTLKLNTTKPPKPKKTQSTVYLRKTVDSDLLLDNYSRHRPSLTIIDSKQKLLSACYFSRIMKGKQKNASQLHIKFNKQPKLYNKRNYGMMNEWKTYVI